MTDVVKHTAKLWERNGIFLYWCPGCGYAHDIPTPRWKFDGNTQSPTFSPSVRHFIPAGYPEGSPERTTCHYNVIAGKIHYCGDCAHALKGQIVDMVDIPQDYGF